RAAIGHLVSLGASDIRSDTSSANTASQRAHLKAGFRLVAMQGEGFDGDWREDHCLYRWGSGE
ncbi:MAG: GNAT family protein, partial [Phycisphaerae bacterium]